MMPLGALFVFLFVKRLVRYVAGMPDTDLNITLGVEEEFFLVSSPSLGT